MARPRTLKEALVGFNAPWMIWAYGLLLLLNVGMTFISLSLISADAPADDPAREVFDLATDSFKIAFGALIGALSMAAQQRWSTDKNDRSDRVPFRPSD
jgi:hypothetical protein